MEFDEIIKDLSNQIIAVDRMTTTAIYKESDRYFISNGFQNIEMSNELIDLRIKGLMNNQLANRAILLLKLIIGNHYLTKNGLPSKEIFAGWKDEAKIIFLTVLFYWNKRI